MSERKVLLSSNMASSFFAMSFSPIMANHGPKCLPFAWYSTDAYGSPDTSTANCFLFLAFASTEPFGSLKTNSVPGGQSIIPSVLLIFETYDIFAMLKTPYSAFFQTAL